MGDSEAKATTREVLEAMAGEGGELGSMNDLVPAVAEFLAQVASPDFVCKLVPRPPVAEQTFPGVEGVSQAWGEWAGTFQDVSAVLEEIRESDDHIVVLVRQVATTRHDAVEMTHPSAMVWRFEDGAVRALEFHLDQKEALRSAGIGPGTDDG